MKIAVATIAHESNTFNPQMTLLSDFIFLVGSEVIHNNPFLKRAPLMGIIDCLREEKMEVVPLVFALPKTEGGIVSKQAYNVIKKSLVEELKRADSLAGVCLDLHGSMTVEDIGDAEGDILETVRQIVGRKLPVVSSLDMHAMVTEKMLENANAFVAFRTAPHVDKYETGYKTASLLCRSLKEGFSLKTAAVSIPFLVSGEMSETEKKPMKGLLNNLKELDKLPGILSSSYCLGFPWADVSFNHVSSLVVTKDDYYMAQEKAVELADDLWNQRNDFQFTTETYPLVEALKIADMNKERPAFITDSCDNPGAGGSQNITYPLEKMIEMGLSDSLLAVIADPYSLALCLKSGIGQEVELILGQKTIDPQDGGFRVKVIVEKITEFEGIELAVVKIGGIDLIITAACMMMTDPQFLFSIGLDPKDYKIIVLKSGYLDPKYTPYAKRTMLGLARGYTEQIFKKLPYHNLQRPIFPIDEIAKWKAESSILKGDMR